jgi:preprotein translocase subunit SecA
MRRSVRSAPDTPYPEKADRDESWLDGALLGAWGRVSPYLLSPVERSRLNRLVQRTEKEEALLSGVTDLRLRQIADEARARLARARNSMREVALPFALAREAARRHRGLRHFPVQLLGGAVMMGGALAEMQTGEGKTLTALLPAIAAGLMGRAVHIITVNDYLARSDAEDLAADYRALGLSG